MYLWGSCCVFYGFECVVGGRCYHTRLNINEADVAPERLGTDCGELVRAERSVFPRKVLKVQPQLGLLQRSNERQLSLCQAVGGRRGVSQETPAVDHKQAVLMTVVYLFTAPFLFCLCLPPQTGPCSYCLCQVRCFVALDLTLLQIAIPPVQTHPLELMHTLLLPT